MEDRCVVCGATVPEGLQVCVPCMLDNQVEESFRPHIIVLNRKHVGPSSRREASPICRFGFFARRHRSKEE